MVESPVDVFVEEPEIGCPVVCKEWACGSAVLGENKNIEGRGMMLFLPTAFHISSSRFKIPVPRKVSLILLHRVVVREDWDGPTVTLSGFHRERNLCGQSPVRT